MFFPKRARCWDSRRCFSRSGFGDLGTSERKAEGRRQKAEGGRQKAEGRRRKAVSSKRKAKGRIILFQGG
ncbi:MAG: hypothetical protein D8M55_06290 [Chloroflexi bacterium]|nr:hypothetical protein [Anaerolineae bacterium]MBL1172037.1 hypothetical protein [Chloroflexota bacterium]MDL1926909.1 hypothetical protein [Anaerolineae bacterium AMX1]